MAIITFVISIITISLVNKIPLRLLMKTNVFISGMGASETVRITKEKLESLSVRFLYNQLTPDLSTTY